MRRQDEALISVEITRFGGGTVTVKAPEDSTLEEVLNKGGITLGASESVFINDELVEMDDILEDGDSIQIVGNKEGGLK